MSRNQPPAMPGIPVDAFGTSVDPTANVRALVQALEKKVGELRTSDKEYYNALIKNLNDSFQAFVTNSERNAEAMRTLVANTATTLAKQTSDQATVLQNQLTTYKNDLDSKILELQKTQYQLAGKSSASEPEMTKFVDKIGQYMTSQDRRSGQGEGMSKSWGLLVGIVGFIALLWTLYHQVSTTQPVYIPVPVTSTVAKP